jgi:hypothetical protein
MSLHMPIQVHVFETTIRVLGGLLSAHVLLDRDRSLVPEYDGLFLRQAQDLADRMLPAFDTRTGLPGPFVHLQQVCSAPSAGGVCKHTGLATNYKGYFVGAWNVL